MSNYVFIERSPAQSPFPLRSPKFKTNVTTVPTKVDVVEEKSRAGSRHVTRYPAVIAPEPQNSGKLMIQK